MRFVISQQSVHAQQIDRFPEVLLDVASLVQQELAFGLNQWRLRDKSVQALDRAFHSFMAVFTQREEFILIARC